MAIKTKNLNGFKNQLRGGGARPNLFEVSIPAFPKGVTTQVAWNKNQNQDLIPILDGKSLLIL